MDKQTFINALENDTFKKKHYSQATIATISQSDLQQLVLWYHPERLDYKHGLFFIRKDTHGEEQQIVLYDNMAYDHYSGQSYPPVWFLEEFFNLSFQQAVHLLNFFYYKVKKAPLREELHNLTGEWYAGVATGTNESLDLSHYITEDKLTDTNAKAEALKRAIAYLSLNRGIDKDIILNLIRQGFMVMDNSNNLCFVTYQDPLEKKDIIAITKKGTLSTKEYKCNIVKEHGTGFFYAKKDFLRTKSYKAVYVFEAVIDLLSFLTLVKQGRIDTSCYGENCCYIALNGANNQGYIDKVLDENPSIETILLGLDNDSKGIKAKDEITKNIADTYSNKTVVDMQYLLKDLSQRYGYCKDFNNALFLKGVDFLGEV